MDLKSLDLGDLEGSPIGRRTYDAIAGSIVKGRLEPGKGLSDRQLAEALGVSRTPVREALHMLASSGLVVRRGRVGWAVSKFGRENVVQVYHARRVIEPTGVEELVNWDESVFQEFETFAGLLKEPPTPGDLTEYLATDRDFHRLLVRSSGNPLLKHFYEIVELQIDRIRHFVPGRNWLRMGESFREHQAILDAVTNRDPERARQAVRDHILAAEKAILDLL